MASIKRGIIKTVMFISSYFPLYIMLIILQFYNYKETYFLFSLKDILYTGVIFVFIIISIVSLILLKISSGSRAIGIRDIERPDDTIISYMMTYIIPILTTSYMDNGEIAVNVILFTLIGYLYVRLNLLYLNPLWSIFGYLSYRINSNLVIITNIKYSDLKQINGKEIKGFYIANDIFIAQKKENVLE